MIEMVVLDESVCVCVFVCEREKGSEIIDNRGVCK